MSIISHMLGSVSRLEPKHVAVVGGGLGGIRTIEALRGAGYRGPITLVAAEEHFPYDRPALSKQVLTGAWEHDRVTLCDAARATELAVDIRLGMRATQLHPGRLTLSDGSELDADAIVLATGLTPRRLAGQPDAPTVHVLRTIEDSLRLRAALRQGGSLLIVGGGFIGAEVASAARTAGMRVTVLEAQPTPLATAVGPIVGTMCGRVLTEAGVELRVNCATSGFRSPTELELADGTTLEPDHILVAIGAVPEVEWLRESGLDLSNGIGCDDTGRALGADGVWAVGDAAAWHGPLGVRRRVEHWSNVSSQAAVVAQDILGTAAPKPELPYFWSDQFGLKFQLIGSPEQSDAVITLAGEGLAGGQIRGTVLGYLAGESLVAAAGFGTVREIARLRQVITDGGGLDAAVAALSPANVPA